MDAQSDPDLPQVRPAGSVRHPILARADDGIRRGQLWGLKWSDVDLDKCEITAHDNRVVVAGHARDMAGGKTENADQTISIDRATASALRRRRGVQDREREFLGTDYHPCGYVFTFEDGRPPHPDTIRQRFDRLAAAAGLSRITFQICATLTPPVRLKAR
jgi:integrase